MDEKVLAVIGNGFDLAHGFETRFDDFLMSGPITLKTKYADLRDDDGSWNSLEKTYGDRISKTVGNISDLDISEFVDHVLAEYGINNYGEVDFYNPSFFEKEIDAVSCLLNKLVSLETDFRDYLKRTYPCDLSSKRQYDNVKAILESSSRIVSFNYTPTIELLYGIPAVEHIHGTIESGIAIGTGTIEHVLDSVVDGGYPSPDDFRKDKYGLQERSAYWNSHFDEDSGVPSNGLVRNQSTGLFFDSAVCSAEGAINHLKNLVDAKNKDALESRKMIIEEIQNCHFDTVHIIGHSLGVADHPFFKAINGDAMVYCYFHDEKEIIFMEDFLLSGGWNHKLMHTNTLYCN